ncbi:unnamed protein product [Euphydryas editha]|uniref:Uncharacterized protein n=1 Tax=Euphydryas editha TaxID=104508 RepID=A0AAU9TR64_EUPED|nr:unnamed protein product [Euphydryas editha]
MARRLRDSMRYDASGVHPGGEEMQAVDASGGSGSGSTTGLRLVDTYDTIAASGDLRVLAIGTDLSSYDANLRYWNFRKAFINALKKVNTGNTFGPESIPGQNMVDYAFGEGRIYKSYWDNGRDPITVLCDDSKLGEEYAKYLK